MARRKPVLAILSVLLMAGSPASMMPVTSDPISTKSGQIAGTQLPSGVKAYLGIPFAAPPVGPLRWAPPQPVSWPGIRNADRKEAACIQVLRPHNINHYFGEEATSEDCLYLNLWAPAEASPASKLPVVVFIYGGGFTIGSSGMANYDGAAMAAKGAIVINFNYRVGAFGFMAHPELSKEQGGHSGNYGLMDQIAALRWIQENVARFGGDPDKVVILGQSAGASSVAAQIFSPLAKGLFRGAAFSSGCNVVAEPPSLESAEDIGLQVQARLGATSIDDLRQVPADRILAIQSESQVGANVAGIRIGGPIRDGYVLSVTRAEALASGKINRVPIIASYNSDDIDLLMSPFSKITTLADYRGLAQTLFAKDAAAFLKLYPASSDAEAKAAAMQVARDSGFALSARQCAQAMTKLGAPAYLDLFSRKHSYAAGIRFADQDPAKVGAYHTADVPFWLGTLDAYNLLRHTRDWTGADRAMADKMMAALIALADKGTASTAEMAWPVWSARSDAYLDLGSDVIPRRYDSARMDWLTAHPIATERLAPRPRD
jgi:para-nitrobenzyl esterase